MSAHVDPATALVHATPGSLQLDYLEKTNGVYLVGYMFSMVLYGFTFFQAYMYYSRYPKDTWGIKTFVALIVGIDTSVSVLLSQTLYYYMVTLFPFTRGVEVASTPFCAQLELSAIAVFLAQLFFAWNIWTNSKNAVMSGITAAFATAAFVFGTITSVKLLDDPIFAHLANNPNKSFAAIAQGLSAGAALAALFGLSFGSLPKGFKPFKSSFDSIVGYGICYGGLAAAIQLGYTFVFVGAPSRHYWFPFQVVATKLFVISSITFLNTRESLTPRASNKEDWSTQSGVTASRTFGGASHHVVSAGTVPGHHTPTEYGVKPIVINVDQSTEREIDEEFRVKREFEPYRG